MNIQTRKLILIEEFIRMNDENLLSKIESLIEEEKKASHERNLKPMSVNEFHEMIDQAIRESDSGQVISHEELKKQVKTWK